MRDDSHRWDAPRAIGAKGAVLVSVSLGAQMLISGTKVRQAAGAALTGWPDIATGDRYTLSLRRDRVLEVGGPARVPGFDAKKGVAVTDMSDAYAVFDLEGPDAFAQLRHGAELRLDQPSRSVVRLLFGIEVLLYRVSETAFRVHVPGPMRMAFLAHIDGTAP